MADFKVKGYRIAEKPLSEDESPEPANKDTVYIPAGTYVGHYPRLPGNAGHTLGRGVVSEVYTPPASFSMSPRDIMVSHRTGTHYVFWLVRRNEVFRAVPE
jgi:hypothetical protein